MVRLNLYSEFVAAVNKDPATEALELLTPPNVPPHGIKLDGPELWEIVFGIADDAASLITDEQYTRIAEAINTVFITPSQAP